VIILCVGIQSILGRGEGIATEVTSTGMVIWTGGNRGVGVGGIALVNSDGFCLKLGEESGGLNATVYVTILRFIGMTTR